MNRVSTNRIQQIVFFIEQEVLKPLLEIYLNAEKVKGSYKARSRNKQQIVFKTRLQ
jgi:hypothetical protein